MDTDYSTLKRPPVEVLPIRRTGQMVVHGVQSRYVTVEAKVGLPLHHKDR